MNEFFTHDPRPGRGRRRGLEGGRRRGRPYGPPMGPGTSEGPDLGPDAPYPPFGPGPGGRGPAPFGPGPFGPGVPVDPFGLPVGPGGRGRGPGRGGLTGRGGRGGRARRGEVRTAILQLLAEEPRNGYQIIATLDQRTEGAWKPSPGAVYPALQQLDDEGLVEAFDNEGTKAYRLTSAGREAPEVSSDTPRPWEQIHEANQPRHHDHARRVWHQYGELAHALRALAASGTEAQHDAALAALAEAQRTIYGILAQAPETDEA